MPPRRVIRGCFGQRHIMIEVAILQGELSQGNTQTVTLPLARGRRFLGHEDQRLNLS
jgi:hypothetical protein